MHITTLISAAITLLGALVVMAWMPGLRTRAGRGAAAAPAVITEVAVPGEYAPAVTGAPVAAEAMAAAEAPAALAAGPARTEG
jgi:hypothetical protein